jgi:hydroxymethylpyrimidine/phosphomethylpyrimidine kinase
MSNKKHPAPPSTTHALTIAGSDSCAGAGIQADIKTLTRLGVEAASVLTAITAQNTAGVSQVHILEAGLVTAQLDAVLTDIPISAAKTGMLANGSIITAVSNRLRRHSEIKLVVDPVMVATSGARLLDPSAEQALKSDLLPLACLVTPNLPEAEVLSGLSRNSRPEDLAEQILDSGPEAVLIKGGHGQRDIVVDLLATRTGMRHFTHRRINARVHGTGCALSAAITAHLARNENLEEAVGLSIDWLQTMISQRWYPLTGTLAMLPFARPRANPA